MSDGPFAGMLEEALEATGLHDFGDDWFQGPLRAWAEDLQQPHLTEFGRRFLRSLAVRELARRLRVLDTLRRHPEIAEVPLPRIVYITGLERSGSTLLHHLLALHADARAFLRWELMAPVPPPETTTYASDPRIEVMQASIEKLRGSLLERMHWVNADEPSECAWGFIDAVSMLGQSPFVLMPRWRHFLIHEDLTPAFEHYRRVAQLLLWKHPVPPGGFLVLKSPQIATHVAAFAAVFPEAHFVLSERDPFRCAVSVAFMGHAIIEPFCVDNPLTDDGHRDRIALAWMRPKLAALAGFTDAEPDRITRLAYPDLVGDPAGTIENVVTTLGLAPDENLAGRIDTFLDAQRSGGRAAPPPSLPTMGYTEEDVLSDPVVRDYCRRFGLRPERSRLTGAHLPG